MESIKVAFLVFEGFSDTALMELAEDLKPIAKKHGYEFILTSRQLDSIPKDELLKAIGK